MEKEVWKQLILKNEMYNYEVSNLGNVRKMDTKYLMALNYNLRYSACHLTHNHVRKSYNVHCLIAIMFNENPYNLPFVNHLNHNKFDNRSVNLEWSTHSDNVKHSHTNKNRVSTGTAVVQYNAKTDKLIKEFKSEAARDLNISTNVVTTCIKNQSKNHGYYLVYKEEQLQKPIIDITDFVPIKNHENYLIHLDSRIYSKYTQIVLNPRKNTYYYVRLDKNNEAIHRLVAFHFIPNPDNKPCVNHKDGNKLNNHVTNLEWCTGTENVQHAIDTGLNPTPKPVMQYTLDGIFVQQHNSVSTACRKLKLKIDCVTEIIRCCDKKIRYAYNFLWKYTNDDKPIQLVSEKEHKDRKVAQYTLDDKLVKIYDTLTDAAVAIGKNKRNTKYISECYFGQVETMYGFKWKPVK